MRSKLLCVIAGLAAGLTLGQASAVRRCTSTEACLRLIQQAQPDMRTMTAAYIQVKHVSLLDEPLVSSGRFIFKRPDRILLKMEQPQPLTVTITGREVHIPNLPERERQALGMAPIAAMFTQLSAVFTGSMQALEQGFEAAAVEDDSAIYVTLVPRQESWKRMFRSIQLRFAGPQLFVQKIRLDDALGDNLEITLSDVHYNIDIPDATFDVAAPQAERSEHK
ncbi:MAG: outer membrane lipoprotein carrier protein LolA [Candidatus Binatia bacterium]